MYVKPNSFNIESTKIWIADQLHLSVKILPVARPFAATAIAPDPRPASCGNSSAWTGSTCPAGTEIFPFSWLEHKFLDKNDRLSNFFWHSARFPTSFCPKVRTLYRKTFLHTILEYRCYVSHAIAGLLSPCLMNACHPTFLSTLPHLILPSDT